MTRRIASAPGKLVLAGEYAVLEGHPGVVAAVDRRATATLVRGAVDDDTSGLRIAGQGTGPHLLVEEPGGTLRLEGDDHDELALIRSVLQVAHDEGIPLPRGTLSADSSAMAVFDEAGQRLKLGVGSSAAVAVAVTTLVAAEARDDSLAATPFELAYRGHRAFSAGSGSGIDVAAAALGGIVEVRRPEATAVPVAIAGPALPAGLTAVCVFTGVSQSTREFLDATRRLRAAAPDVYRESIERAGDGARAFLAAARGGDSDALLDAVHACRRAMAQLGELAGIDIVSAPHRRIAEHAETAGGAAKPSGAGGGDVGIAFLPREAAADFAALVRRDGFQVVKLTLGAPGARTELVDDR